MIEKQLKRKSPKVPWGWIIFALIVSGLILWGFAQFKESNNREQGNAIETVRPKSSSADSPIMGGIGKGSISSSGSVLAKPKEQSEAVFGGSASAVVAPTTQVQITPEVSTNTGGFFPPTVTSVPEQATATLTPEILDTPTLTLTQEGVITPTETLEPTPTETETPMPTLTIKPVTPTPTDTLTPSATARPFSDRMKEVLDQGAEGIIGQVQSSVESAKNALDRLPEAVKEGKLVPTPTRSPDEIMLNAIEQLKSAVKAKNWIWAETLAEAVGQKSSGFTGKVQQEYIFYISELDTLARNTLNPGESQHYKLVLAKLAPSRNKVQNQGSR